MNAPHPISSSQPLSAAAARARRLAREGRVVGEPAGVGLESPRSFTALIPGATLPVAERFVSINGEGAHAGRLAAFIRFAGCNLSCAYCDTRWANDMESTVAFYSIDELVAWASEQPAACVTITGGEPTLQQGLPDLVERLCELPGIEVVEVETNGAVDLTTLVAQRPEKLRITMDHKLPSSGMEERMLASNFDLLAPYDVVKFVIGTPEDLEQMYFTLNAFDLDGRCRVYLSPVFGAIEPAAIVDFMKQHHLVNATLQLQLHKIIWPDAERGV